MTFLFVKVRKWVNSEFLITAFTENHHTSRQRNNFIFKVWSSSFYECKHLPEEASFYLLFIGFIPLLGSWYGMVTCEGNM